VGKGNSYLIGLNNNGRDLAISGRGRKVTIAKLVYDMYCCCWYM